MTVSLAARLHNPVVRCALREADDAPAQLEMLKKSINFKTKQPNLSLPPLVGNLILMVGVTINRRVDTPTKEFSR